MDRKNRLKDMLRQFASKGRKTFLSRLRAARLRKAMAEETVEAAEVEGTVEAAEVEGTAEAAEAEVEGEAAEVVELEGSDGEEDVDGPF